MNKRILPSTDKTQRAIDHLSKMYSPLNGLSRKEIVTLANNVYNLVNGETGYDTDTLIKALTTGLGNEPTSKYNKVGRTDQFLTRFKSIKEGRLYNDAIRAYLRLERMGDAKAYEYINTLSSMLKEDEEGIFMEYLGKLESGKIVIFPSMRSKLEQELRNGTTINT